MSRPKCLDCGEVLDGKPDGTDCVTCQCGVRYSVQLMNDSDMRIWETVRKHRLFDRDGSMLTVSHTRTCPYCGQQVAIANWHEGPEDCIAEAEQQAQPLSTSDQKDDACTISDRQPSN